MDNEIKEKLKQEQEMSSKLLEKIKLFYKLKYYTYKEEYEINHINGYKNIIEARKSYYLKTDIDIYFGGLLREIKKYLIERNDKNGNS